MPTSLLVLMLDAHDRPAQSAPEPVAARIRPAFRAGSLTSTGEARYPKPLTNVEYN